MKRFTLLSILIIIFTGCSQSPEQLVKNGDAFIDNKKYDEAIKLYEQVLKKYPGNIEAHRGIINAYEGKSMWEVIFGDYKAKYDKNPNDPLLAYLVGNCYARKDNFIKAFEYYNKAESLGFKSKWLYYSRSSCYVSIGIILTKKEKAITEFRQLSLSNAFDAFNKAVESCNKALQLDKEMLAAYEMLCDVFNKLDRDKDALNMAIEAEKRGSKESVIYMLLAQDASSGEKYDNVIKYTSKLVECNSDENTYLIYAAVVAPRSDAGGIKGELKKKALADLAEGINKYPALKKDPTFVACYVALLSPDKKAVVFLNECLKATPNLAEGNPLLLEVKKKLAEIETQRIAEENRCQEEEKYKPASTERAVNEWEKFRKNEESLIGTVTTWRLKIFSPGKCPAGSLAVEDHGNFKNENDVEAWHKALNCTVLIAVLTWSGISYEEAAASNTKKYPVLKKDDIILITGKFAGVSPNGYIILEPIRIVNEGYK